MSWWAGIWLGLRLDPAASWPPSSPGWSRSRTSTSASRDLLQQKKRAETIRDSLLAQIRTIRAVDGNRYVWPHVLDEVAKSLPPYTWLTSLAVQGMTAAVVDSADTTERPMQFKMEGRTMDIQAYTRFLRQLEASPWIEDVTPLEASTVVEHGASGHQVHDPGHLQAGGLGLYPDRATQPVGEVSMAALSNQRTTPLLLIAVALLRGVHGYTGTGLEMLGIPGIAPGARTPSPRGRRPSTRSSGHDRQRQEDPGRRAAWRTCAAGSRATAPAWS